VVIHELGGYYDPGLSLVHPHDHTSVALSLLPCGGSVLILLAEGL